MSEDSPSSSHRGDESPLETQTECRHMWNYLAHAMPKTHFEILWDWKESLNSPAESTLASPRSPTGLGPIPFGRTRSDELPPGGFVKRVWNKLERTTLTHVNVCGKAQQVHVCSRSRLAPLRYGLFIEESGFRVLERRGKAEAEQRHPRDTCAEGNHLGFEPRLLYIILQQVFGGFPNHLAGTRAVKRPRGVFSFRSEAAVHIDQ